jgi:hypothetical protein
VAVVACVALVVPCVALVVAWVALWVDVVRTVEVVAVGTGLVVDDPAEVGTGVTVHPVEKPDDGALDTTEKLGVEASVGMAWGVVHPAPITTTSAAA